MSVSYDDGEGAAKNAEQSSTEATRAAPVTNHAPSFADGAAERSVAENSPARTPVGAPVAATDDDNDPLGYSLSGDGAGSFSIDSDGQISVGDTTTLDHESKDSYQFTLSVSDNKDANGNADDVIDDTIAVTVTVSDVDEAPVLSGPSVVGYDENGTSEVAGYAATDPDGDNIWWSLTGADSGDFSIDSSGRLTFTLPPDFEHPSDSDEHNDYQVTVNASDGPLSAGPLTATVSVTVTVDNIDEAGTVALSSLQPQAGTEFVAALDDPDGAIENRSWSWQRSQDRTDWSVISGAAPAATPHQKPISATSWG